MAYEQHFLGFNYRITDIQAVLVTHSLKGSTLLYQLGGRLVKVFQRIDHESLNMPSLEEISTSSNHLFIVKLKIKKREFTR